MIDDRKPTNRFRAVCFDPLEPQDQKVVQTMHFRIEENMRLEYHAIPSYNGAWDFEHTVSRKDTEKDGLIRMMKVGEKQKTIRNPRTHFGKDGRILLQLISTKVDGSAPIVEAGKVMSLEELDSLYQDGELIQEETGGQTEEEES